MQNRSFAHYADACDYPILRRRANTLLAKCGEPCHNVYKKRKGDCFLKIHRLIVVLMVIGWSSQPAIAQDAVGCFYCGKWSVLSRVFYEAATLSIEKNTITWPPCGPVPVSFSVINETETKADVYLAPSAYCELHDEAVRLIRFELREDVFAPNTFNPNQLSVSLFGTEGQYRANYSGTWGVYLRAR